MPSWLILAAAIVSEVTGTLGLRAVDGLHRVLPLVAVVVGYTVSFALLAILLKRYDVGFLYAVWSGTGTALVAAIGIAAFGEPATALKLGSLALVIGGVVGLNLAGGH